MSNALVFTNQPRVAHRLVFAGDLSTRSGAADLLISVSMWAEHHPERPVEIWWIGEGELESVLVEQPLPASVSQSFLGSLELPQIATVFGHCGLLVVPSSRGDKRGTVAEGLATGLLVLGSSRNRSLKKLVRNGVNGWLFDPREPGAMFTALSEALTMPAERLDSMRETGRIALSVARTNSVALRIRHHLMSIMPDGTAGLKDPNHKRANADDHY